MAHKLMLLTDEQREAYFKKFSEFDNGDGSWDGSIPNKNLGDALKSVGEDPTKAELQRLLMKYNKEIIRSKKTVELEDVGQLDGTTTYFEFVPMILDMKYYKHFKALDKDGNNIISRDEIRQVMLTVDPQIREEVINGIIGEVDRNRDGKVNFEEFIEMMLITE